MIISSSQPFRLTLLFFLSMASFSASLLILLFPIHIDPYISLTTAFALSMATLYLIVRKLSPKPLHYRYAGDFLLYSTAGYLIAVLFTAILRQRSGSVLPWSIIITALVILFGIMVYPGAAKGNGKQEY